MKTKLIYLLISITLSIPIYIEYTSKSISKSNLQYGICSINKPKIVKLNKKINGIKLYEAKTKYKAKDSIKSKFVDKLNYVQEINLKQGANLKLLYKRYNDDKGIGQGYYSPDSCSFIRRKCENWTDEFLKSEKAFSIVNAQFFAFNPKIEEKRTIKTAQLAFPIKSEGEIITGGYGPEEIEKNQVLLLEWDKKSADIVNLLDKKEKNNFNPSQMPNIIAGLSENINKDGRKDEIIGRTYIGIKDEDLDNVCETILIFSSKNSTQENAIKILKENFNAKKIVMFDGEGSSFLILNKNIVNDNNKVLTDGRLIPQAIGVYERSPF